MVERGIMVSGSTTDPGKGEKGMDLELTKDIGDVRERLGYLKAKSYMDNSVAEALRINYIVHIELLLSKLRNEREKE